MESNQIEVYQISAADQTNDSKENIVLRALVGDPHRHKPLAEHSPPSDALSSAKLPASMYTLETRYRPIPQYVLPPSDHQNHALIHSEAQGASPADPAELDENKSNQRNKERSHLQTDLIESQVISTPVLYTIVDNKTILPSVEEPESEIIPTKTEQMPILYNLIGSPRLQVQIQEPVKPSVIPSTSPQPSPSLYSIIGNPGPIPTIIEDQSEITKPVRPTAPPPSTPVQKSNEEVMMYAVVGQPQLPAKTTPPRKAKSFDTTANKAVETPTFYTLISKPKSPASDNLHDRSKQSPRKKSPPPVVIPLRLSRSLDRKQAKQPLAPIPPIKTKESKSKEPIVFIPLREEDRLPPRMKKQRTNPWESTTDQSSRQPYLINQYEPLRFGDYRSPYAYSPQKTNLERRSKTIVLPPLRKLRSERKSRGHQTSSSDTKQTNSTNTPHSSERYPVNTRQRSRLWDYEYQTHSDGDDDTDYETRFQRKKQRFRRFRPRTPWVPVW